MKYTLDNLKKADDMLTIATLIVVQENPDNINYQSMADQYVKHLSLKAVITMLELNGELNDNEIETLDALLKEEEFKAFKILFEESQDDNATSNS